MNNFTELDYRPCKLDPADKAGIALQLASFYQNHQVYEVEELLWQLYRGWLQQEALLGTDAQTLGNMLVFYEDLRRLVVASYVKLKTNHAEPLGIAGELNWLDIPGGIPEALLPALELLVRTVKPVQLFLCRYPGFTEEGPAEKYEILVMAKAAGQKLNDLKPYLNLSMLACQDCQCHIFVGSRLDDAFKNGDLYYLMSCTRENLIYDPEQRPLPKIAVADLPEKKDKLEKLFAFADAMAFSFLEQAGLNYRNSNWRMAAFMLHQCAEHCYRAVISAYTGDERRSHEISVLSSQAGRIAPAMQAVFPGNNAAELRLLKLLDDVYAKARYQESFAVSEQELEVLLSRISLLYTETGKAFVHIRRLLTIAE